VIPIPDRIVFQRKARDRVLRLLEQGIPIRDARFIQALKSFYNTPSIGSGAFSLSSQSQLTLCLIENKFPIAFKLSLGGRQTNPQVPIQVSGWGDKSAGD